MQFLLFDLFLNYYNSLEMYRQIDIEDITQNLS